MECWESAASGYQSSSMHTFFRRRGFDVSGLSMGVKLFDYITEGRNAIGLTAGKSTSSPPDAGA